MTSAEMLPTELWLHILSYLDFRDLLRCGTVSRTLNEISAHDYLWRTLCNKYWLETKCPEDLSWKDNFIKWYHDFGRYIHHYSRIKQAWNQLENFMKSSCPKIFSSIFPGVSESKLDAIEEKIHYKLPLDLRCSHRIHNGQKLDCPSLFGSVNIGEHYRTLSLLNLDVAVEFIRSRIQGFKGVLPLTFCVNTGCNEFIALTEEEGLSLNHIYCPSESGLHGVSGLHFFISGSDFASWFTNYVDALNAGSYSLMENQVFRFFHEPNCVQATDSIKVSVSTAFLPECSTINPPYFLHVYHITMQMDEFGPESESCQLESRHWIITDDNGHEERVDGNAVVGQYPIMRPGASFTWISCTNFKTTYGNMKGHFTMRNLKTGRHKEIYCPIFHMKCLPYMTVPIQDTGISRME